MNGFTRIVLLAASLSLVDHLGALRGRAGR